MERLTKILEDGRLLAYPNNNTGLPEIILKSDPYYEVLSKLNEYQDMEEQGRLVKLPCKVGDTVYVLVEMDDNEKYTRVKNDVVKSFYISPDNIPMIEFTYIWHDTYINDFGKSVFLTREQAEQALKQEKQ